MNNTFIKTNLFRVRYKRKDGKQQLKVLVKVGYKSNNKFNELKRYEVTIRDKFNNTYLVTEQDYKRLKSLPPKPERLFLYELEIKTKKIVLDLLSAGKDFSTNEINNRLYSIQSEDAVDIKVNSWNEFLNKISSDENSIEYQREEIEEIEKAIKVEEKINGVLTDEEIDNIKDAVGIEIQIAKEKEFVNTLNFNERYVKKKFNKDDIIEVFGFCWSINSKNSDPYVADSYKVLIFHLADYFINGERVSKSIKNFDLKWVENFLVFKYKKGYPTTHFKDYTPFDIFNHRDSFYKSPRQVFKAASFRKLVKILKQYIFILQKKNLIPINAINTSHIVADEFISRDV